MFKFLLEGNKVYGYYIVISIIMLNGLGMMLGMQRLTTIVLLPLLFIFGLLFNLGILEKIPVEFGLLILIFLSSIISSFFAVSFDSLLRDISMSIGVLISAIIPIVVNTKRDYYLYFFSAFALSFLIVSINLYFTGAFQDDITEYSDRSRFLLNANSYSYLAYFGNISLFYLHQRYQTKFVSILLIGYFALSVYVSLITASRSGFGFAILINGIYWLWIFKPKSRFIYNIIIAVFATLAIYKFYDIFKNSYLNQRVEYSAEHGDSRQGLAMEAVDVFIVNPFFGVGPGQFVHYSMSGSYSHNSYTEIAANQGLVGLGLLLLLFFVCFYEALILFKKNSDVNNFIKINILFYLTFFVYNNFYPFYKYTFSMMFLFLIISFQKNLINSLKYSFR